MVPMESNKVLNFEANEMRFSLCFVMKSVSFSCSIKACSHIIHDHSVRLNLGVGLVLVNRERERLKKLNAYKFVQNLMDGVSNLRNKNVKIWTTFSFPTGNLVRMREHSSHLNKMHRRENKNSCTSRVKMGGESEKKTLYGNNIKGGKRHAKRLHWIWCHIFRNVADLIWIPVAQFTVKMLCLRTTLMY